MSGIVVALVFHVRAAWPWLADQLAFYGSIASGGALGWVVQANACERFGIDDGDDWLGW